MVLRARGGETIQLDATGSCDPDGNALRHRWWHYTEPSAVFGLKTLAIAGQGSARATIIMPAVTEPITYHIILDTTDDGAMPITRYRRILIEVKP